MARYETQLRGHPARILEAESAEEAIGKYKGEFGILDSYHSFECSLIPEDVVPVEDAPAEVAPAASVPAVEVAVVKPAPAPVASAADADAEDDDDDDKDGEPDNKPQAEVTEPKPVAPKRRVRRTKSVNVATTGPESPSTE